MKKIQRIISVSGYSNSGKTTLISEIIRELKNRNLKVGLIKHSHHEIETGDEKKDTGRQRKSGAEITCAFTENKASICIEKNIVEYFADILNLYKNMDIVIIEGMSKSKFRGIEVLSYENFIKRNIRKAVEPEIYYIVCDKYINTNDIKEKNVILSSDYDNIAKVCDIIECGIISGFYDIDTEKIKEYI
ncbi:molybdopterin-guanine dinucleotide biosynthesis protein B [Peptacetobacter hominis]|uniref:Molybdopterin-guanine dinucleotide biosynthesis protein B n=1 Tax=Peptacetobacter hominis TaxID=2743610 RepID=A0A544QTU0_9FIRM|nr:molybdopterin-guanine dinucleotide biosynthesis protein B [Peptacetobacter hominis]TQQ84109.1 molybdopterin-guanine dinucleotide biosynthesis protein B [Peptacetobacter hominis]